MIKKRVQIMLKCVSIWYYVPYIHTCMHLLKAYIRVWERFALAWQPRSHKLQNRSFIHSLNRKQNTKNKDKVSSENKSLLMFALELDINWSTLQSNAFKISNRGKLMMRFMLQSWKPQDNKLCYCYNIACSLSLFLFRRRHNINFNAALFLHIKMWGKIILQEIGNANFTPYNTHCRHCSLSFELRGRKSIRCI